LFSQVTRFSVKSLPLEGLKLVERKPLGDSRGSFARLYCAAELQSIWPGPISQINHTCTAARGTVRGLHYQTPPHSERKHVSCLRGSVWDVVVDLRAGSPTFLQWHAEMLSAENCRALLVPEGFAHGFQTLSDDVEMIYLHSVPHVAEAEAGVSPFDSVLGIPWPETVSAVSDRDKSHPPLAASFAGLNL
jgi:dTDP-4-dehydrorhamnose 3,5-epimerase